MSEQTSAKGLSRRERVLAWVAAGSAVLISAGVCELILQVVDYPRLPSDHSAFLEPDPVLGWRTRGGASGPYVSDEYVHELTFDQQGFRIPAGGGRSTSPDVLVVGDSFVEGYSVRIEDRFPEQLAAALDTTACRADVLGFGVAGYSTVQQLLWLEQHLEVLSPDYVVLMFYFNDIWHNAEERYAGVPKPYSVIHDDGTLGIEPPESVLPESPRSPVSPLERVKLYRLVERATKRIGFLRTLAQGVGLFDPQEAVLAAPAEMVSTEMSVFEHEPDSAAQLAWIHTERLLSAMDSVVTRRGAELIVSYVPMRGEVRGLGSGELTRLAEEGGWELAAVRERLDRACTSLELTCFSFFAPLRRAFESGRPVYYNLDTHWTPLGHETAARALAEFLSSEQTDLCPSA